ncbi:MAG: YraN family protein [Oscillospiraceae bacterium]|nr:YraN family protein [Oscillospiraceae bacterium]
MKKRTNLLGPWGEQTASADLRRRGYEIVAANYRTRFGEIDLIARQGGFTVFVEVKLRASDRFAEAREFVDRRKQERLRASALLWLAAHPEDGGQPRFDVVEVYAPEGLETKKPVIRHLENAF